MTIRVLYLGMYWDYGDESRGRSFEELGIYADEAERQRIFELIVRNGFIEAEEFRYRSSDGSLHVGLLSSRPITLRGLSPVAKYASSSFSVTPSKRLWRCFGCDAAGTPTQFVQRYFGLSSRADAIERIRSWGLWPEVDEAAGVGLVEHEGLAGHPGHGRRPGQGARLTGR